MTLVTTAGLVLKVFPSARSKLTSAAIAHEADSLVLYDAADRGDRNAGNAAWDAFARRDGEQQFVVLPTVQSEALLDLVWRPADGGEG